jgi:hypothetical protein
VNCTFAKLYSSFKLGTRWGGWSTPRPGSFTPGKDTVPIVQEAGWVPQPVWTGVENFAPTGIRPPDSPARSESLCWLRYPGPTKMCNPNNIYIYNIHSRKLMIKIIIIIWNRST